MKFKRYERYKDSGVEWIGEIPEEWRTVPLKRIFKIINGGTPSSSEESYWNGEIIWVTPNDLSKLTGACIVASERKITEDGFHNCSARMVPKGSIVISTRAPIGYVAIAGVPLCTNQGCKSLVLIRGGDTKYFYYCFLSLEKYLNVLGQGTTFIELSNSNLSMVELLNPSINEQTAIANFLDQKTAEIDDLIADKEKLIELLQEKRQAIITEAVTKGLNPNVRMKDSGVEWIGEIPEHWEVKPLKRIFKIINGGTPRSSEEIYWNGEIVWITPNDLSMLTKVYIKDSERKITKHGLYNCSAKIVPSGSIIISTRAPIGYVAIAGVDLCTNQGCKSLVAIKKVNSKYFYYWISSINFYLNALGQGTTFMELSNDNLSIIEMLIPPITEQKEIAKFLDQKTNKIDDVVYEIKSQIQKLKEYRQSLIYEAVTGKIDVRDYNIIN